MKSLSDRRILVELGLLGGGFAQFGDEQGMMVIAEEAAAHNLQSACAADGDPDADQR